ncbi:MAG TPA: DUF1573 domain-containing protein, partial [Candidatus Solibacter sp.]|nr:DUF1573 domain-containing protein [Candidatus Solibacter sp.]
AATATCADSTQVSFPETRHNFGSVQAGSMVEHDFVLKNQGPSPVRIQRVLLTSPMIVTRMQALTPPGGESTIHVKLDTTTLRGHFEGEVRVMFNDGTEPQAVLGFEGEIAPVIELLPGAAFYVGARRGEVREGTIEIINRQTEPIEILEVRHSTQRFTTRLDTIEPGRRFRLTLLVKPDGPGGRYSEPILITTSSPNLPKLTVTANTLLRERVYAFPDGLDFGAARRSDIESTPGLLERTAQTLMVYQYGGADFRIEIRSDLPFLVVQTERGPQGDRYQNTVKLLREKLQPGPFRGSLLIKTNDVEFPSLVVPVTGEILDH